MPRLPTEQIVLLIFQASILLGLVFRVWTTRLYRVYPCFFGYLLTDSVQTLLLPLIPYNSTPYIYCWVVTQALLTCLCVLIVLELYTLILRNLKGIASASRRYLKICLTISILVSLMLLLVEQTPRGITNTFMTIDRALITSLLIFVLLLTAFLIYYPVPINRNLVVYSIGYAVYFLAKASGLLLVNISHAWYREFNIVVVTASTISMLFWLVGLSAQGEKKTMVIGHRWNQEDQEEILERLKAINARLLGAGRQ